MRRIEAVIFDWAGTMVDFGSIAPVRAITETFARRGISISDAEARRDMGIYKKDHLRRILFERNGDACTGQDVDSLFEDFQPIQMQVLEAHSRLIPGAAAIAQELRSRGIKIGSTTGYTRPMLDVLLSAARDQGYDPDLSLCPDDAFGGGRPLPWMCLSIALQFRMTSVSCAVKVGDTISDIEEGLNAGMWTVGVTRTGNEIGLQEQDLQELPSDDRTTKIAEASERLRAAGAHFVVECACDIGPVLEEIDRRLRAGLRP